MEYLNGHQTSPISIGTRIKHIGTKFSLLISKHHSFMKLMYRHKILEYVQQFGGK